MLLAVMTSWSLGAADGLRVLRAGVAEGRLRGGCISIYAEALGTPYAPRVGAETILFLEDIGTKPYQWDRILLHLRYAGRLEGVKGIVFGDMRSVSRWRSRSIWRARFCMRCGILTARLRLGLRSGHVDGANITLPLGISVRLDLADGENSQMQFLEAAVTV